ncbi:MAG: aspartyl protease family protein, partial [Candidatus Velthaea sp.]
VYESGRHSGLHWRRTPSGLVRLVEADVQGDDLDRWPASIFPFDAAACKAAGETADARPSWVLACRAPHDVPHWFYVEKRSGDITREIVREGVRVVTFTFEDFRSDNGFRRPFRWHLAGAGGAADVLVQSVAPSAVGATEVADPPSVTGLFQWDAAGAAAVPARFRGNEILVEVAVDGRRGTFVLDTGTTQLIMSTEFARRIGLRAALGHVVAGRVTVGQAVMRDVPMLTVGLGGFRIDGLLGYDFFVGHIVHIDYARERVELLPRTAFVPPVGAEPVAAPAYEGMPLVAARAGKAEGSRFALDTGSQTLVLARRLLNAAGLTPDDFSVRSRGGRDVTQRYLEGSVTVQRAVAATFRFGPVLVREAPAEIELPAGSDDLELPLDGIVGTDIMAGFEWWFDADGDRLWLRRR